MLVLMFNNIPGTHPEADVLNTMFTQTGPFGPTLLNHLCSVNAALFNSNQVSLANPPVDLEGFECFSENNGTINIPLPDRHNDSESSWLFLTNGNYLAQTDPIWLQELLASRHHEVVFLTVDPELSSFREKVRYNQQGQIIGFRRHYADVAWQDDLPDNWPHHILVRKSAVQKMLCQGQLQLNLNFGQFLDRCGQIGVKFHSLRIAGFLTDLNNSGELRELTRVVLQNNPLAPIKLNSHESLSQNDSPCLFGRISRGHNVRIDSSAIIIGPTVIGDNVTIGPDSIIRSAVIPSGATVSAHQVIDSCVLPAPGRCSLAGAPRNPTPDWLLPGPPPRTQWYKSWPKYSYVELYKRWADIAFSLIILTLFLPFFPIVVAAIKINSPGPIFFKHKRQGRYGREFGCIKFRTMMKDADKMQDQLRLLNRNQVDGPQFKMENDPRVSTVGKFLRDTSIDEIPQFINVLMGQMSVVGPRPSPERENTFCASWRDARLSVRPGITGLWQVCRTREEGRDFQEWVVHDTRYVREVNWKLDIWICWKTVIYIIKSILDKF